MRYIAPLAMAATAAVVGFAPIAAAAPTAITTNTGAATVVQSPGNARITAQPGVAAQNAAENSTRSLGTGMGAACSSTTAVTANR